MTGIKGVGYKDGAGNDGDCDDPSTDIDQGLGNELGFRPGGTPTGCDQLRYFYQFNAAGDVAVASAASDARDRHIYPDCSGVADCEECGYRYGDALTMALGGGKPEVCRNIAKYCPDGASCDTPPPCPATTTCLATETPHTTPPCCRPITCPTTCPVGETPHTSPPCCRPTPICNCVSNVTPGTVWAPTTASLDLNNKYTCEAFYQTTTDTKTWTETPAGCTPSLPCPPSLDIVRDQIVHGSNAPDCSNDADRGISACPCVDGDLRTTALENCCAACNVTLVTSTWSGKDGADNDLNLAGKWECTVSTEAGLVTTTRSGGAHCLDTSTTTSRIVCGDIILSCGSWCTGDPYYGSNWGDCEQTSAGPPRVCKQEGTAPRFCTSPCASTSEVCQPDTFFDQCSATTTVRRPCTCPALCTSGDYVNETLTDASESCRQLQPPPVFSYTWSNGGYDCRCGFESVAPCVDEDGAIVAVKDCADDETWHGAPDCACLTNSGGTVMITIYPSCIGAAVADNVPTGLLSDSNFPQNNPFKTASHAQWKDLLEKILCSGYVGVFANYAAVQTMRTEIMRPAYNCHKNTTSINNITFTCGGGQ